ncbi:MAG: hypothetical protein CL810_03560 [Cobetia sp.]|jgi:hypothetical protein|uniref:Uncharacterized protein n=1 Tax=Cobetia amphilecti TaxID=1055104 RepID=A0AAP4WYN0_9GAMM|nr:MULTISPECIES: hypothetical protein [Cobetia]AVV34589.1 hypothetical protein C8233_13890 [Halomonas sp. SF2003]MBR9755786.1 hypothetical protein [Gammaproteobacteria bacterium]NVN57037.1 hypothetical protein [bacterium Scap17]TCJ27099.1 hypothetical protein E0X81_15900 [Halomonas sp. GDM18]KGA02198.1 hypothetical protein KP05_08110 [Cobetia amphilecti]|tara:strand:- start:127 stop:348 length:222 start_codon:yes stop_codon:yes gene_type:complete
MLIATNTLLILGLAIVLFAYGLYIRRTQDMRGVLMFWSRKLALTALEFRLQRFGILVMLGGVVIRYLEVLRLF